MKIARHRCRLPGMNGPGKNGPGRNGHGHDLKILERVADTKESRSVVALGCQQKHAKDENVTVSWTGSRNPATAYGPTAAPRPTTGDVTA